MDVFVGEIADATVVPEKDATSLTETGVPDVDCLFHVRVYLGQGVLVLIAEEDPERAVSLDCIAACPLAVEKCQVSVGAQRTSANLLSVVTNHQGALLQVIFKV